MKLKTKMKSVAVIAWVFFFAFLLTQVVCESTRPEAEQPGQVGKDFNISDYSGYTAVKIDIVPLTEFIRPKDAQGPTGITVYLSLLDPFGCQIKSPGIFRFELYEKARGSAEPKGRRINIWPDFDLTEPSENNKHWRDFLRAYRFNLDLGQQINQGCVLEATCLCPDDRRLSADFELKYAK